MLDSGRYYGMQPVVCRTTRDPASECEGREMLKNARSTVPSLLTAGALAAVVVLVPGATVGAAPVVTNVQVNKVFAGPFPTNKQNEPSLAQNPTNPLKLIAGSNDEIGEPSCTNTTPSSCPFV